MWIENNILKHYLRNCYFINGTAYAGKSTMCKLLAEKYGMTHCEENYNHDLIMSVATPERQPNLSYFRTMQDWQAFVTRTPEEYTAWVDGNSEELAGFEVAELIRISQDRRVIVDTNIPCPLLAEISDYDHVAIMLSPQSMSVEQFFEREDAEKRFLLSELQKCPDPDAALANFKACIARVNSRERYDAFLHSGFFTLVREDCERDTRQEMLTALARHFGLEAEA